MLDYGTNIVAGVTPGKIGITTLGNIPVFDLVEQPVRRFGADTSIIFVPPAFAGCNNKQVSGIKTVVCITEGVPIHDMVKVKML